MTYSIIATLGPTAVVKAIRDCQSAIVDVFGGGTVIQLPLHVTLARMATALTSQQEIRMQDALNAGHSQISVLLGQCEVLKEAGIIWIKVLDDQSMTALAGQIGEIVQRVAAIDGEGISFATVPHITLAYRDYSESEIAAIFEFSAPRCASILPTSVVIESIVLCKRDQRGAWHVAV